jgi:hypothetical protein
MSFFRETMHNVTNQPNIDPKAKLLIALKTLAFGVSVIAFNNYFQMGVTTAHKYLQSFCQFIRANAELHQPFMRPMNREDGCKMRQSKAPWATWCPGNDGQPRLHACSLEKLSNGLVCRLQWEGEGSFSCFGRFC